VIAFTCPKCQQALEFKDAAAGRIVRCRGCQARLRAPGQLTETGGPRPVRKKRRPLDEDESVDVGETPEWIAPTVLLGLGLVLAVGGMAVTQGRDGFAAGLEIVALRLLLTVPFSVAGLFIAAPLLGLSFGPFTLAILKLAAISALELGLAMTAQFGGVPAWAAFTLVAPVGWLLFNWLFRLEPNETLFVLTVIWLIQFLVDLTVTAARLRAGG
jgi:hypothetical protein